MKGLGEYIFESDPWNKKWTYDTCKEEAKKYHSRAEFKKGNQSAYGVARKNKWLDEYDWFEESKTGKKWTYDTCKEEARKYHSLVEFYKSSSGAYNVAWKNKWLDEYDWLEKKFHEDWTYDTCKEEARKYHSRAEFSKSSHAAYLVALKNKWLDEYDWLEERKKQNGYWNYDTCKEEAKKYHSRGEFKKGNDSAYRSALRNNWLDEYDWLLDKRFDLYKDPIDSVYVYEFPDLNAAYVGRTLMKRQTDRDREHIFNTEKDAVAKFAKENGVTVPKPKYLEQNLTIEQGAKQEGYWEKKYRDEGWYILNRTKTGSIGTLGKGKWNKESCEREARKYHSRAEFLKGNSSAYQVARKNKWLDEYDWLEERKKQNGYWNYDTCKEEAKKYHSRREFLKGNASAYLVARVNKWLDEYDWFEERKKQNGYWTYDTCKEEARKYRNRTEFVKGNKSAYNVARKNKWLDDFYPKQSLREFTETYITHIIAS